MWLERLSGQSSQPTPLGAPAPRTLSPAPRRSAQLGPSTLPRRPGLGPRTSSLTGLSAGSVESLPPATRLPAGTSLKNEISSSPGLSAPDPMDVLHRILGPEYKSKSHKTSDGLYVLNNAELDSIALDIDFEGLGLEDFVASEPNLGASEEGGPEVARSQLNGDFEQEKFKFEELHRSISSCDEALKAVETYLTRFRTDLAAVSSEIEHLQDRSIALDQKLDNLRAVDKALGPEIECLHTPPHIIRKLTEDNVDDSWVRALDELDRRSRTIESRLKERKNIKAAEDVQPLIDKISARAVERIRDYVVSQIKTLRTANVNAQVLQQTALLKYKSLFGFMASRQPQLAEEVSQAYVNTMRWYYLSNFTRYKTALERLSLFTFDQSDALGVDPATKKTRPGSSHHDAFSIGRRGDKIQYANDAAISASVAEEDKNTHHFEIPFRAFNLALVDNASAEYSFLSEFFSKQPFQALQRKSNEIMTPTFQLGYDLTKHLIDGTMDAIGVLICVRLTQHFAFELQRRKIPSVEGYINGTNMLLWPRFQQIMDAHCESVRRATASLPGKPAGSALSLGASPGTPQNAAPHPLTQRFTNFLQAILYLSTEAGDDEPVSSSLSRLRTEFEAFLVKLSKGITEPKKRERFLHNNYSLVATIINDTEGKLAEEMKTHFVDLQEATDAI
ncbi:Vps52-domain-containing protein [Piedraia hortae CBS 480.64]|uniref:Vps52-domain-containing protein n=1 Tax=Piedraia hortae CBS 480.64 TaxID=1314780 RepID=A0A6A7C266_9PEZI|nr:Vps52-domain-containing protein [Piedraia hortae CBS 480.64]